MNIVRACRFTVLLVAGLLMAGCSSNMVSEALLPNPDPALRHTRGEFAADAATRQPFKAALPSAGDARGRAMVDYGNYTVQIVNISDEDWNNVEIWVNRKYVVFVPLIPRQSPQTTKLNFHMFFDGEANSFPAGGNTQDGQIKQVEMVRNGKLYSIKFTLD